MSEVHGLVDYLEDFIARHTVQGDIGVALDVSSEEYQALVDFLFNGMIVWMLGVERARWNRRRRNLVEIPPAEQPSERSHDEEAIKKNYENKNVVIWRVR
jgi:hypothetical protein